MMRALADDQVVTHFVYDGNNERVLKLSETWHRIFTNSEKSGEDKDAEVEVEMFYTLYPNQYVVIRPDGNYTKHYYMGSERIASKIGDPEGYLVGDPTSVTLAVANNTQATLEAYVDENYGYMELDIDIFRPATIEDPSLGMSNSGFANEPMTYFFHKDQVGSSSFITDGVGDPIQFIGYTPFGESFINVSATHFQTPYRFNGKEQDAETGLYNYGARYYDPKISRWMSVDPLADHPNQVDKSPYAYAWNNPVRLTDPDGRCPDCPDETYVPLAEHVYGAQMGDVTSNGWEVVGVTNNDSGLQGALYKGTADSGFEGEHIYATAGTQDFKDVGADIKQAFGGSKQYSESVGIARGLTGNEDYEGVSFTGHSLGGGLASANALATNGKAVTFNAAGISGATKKGLGLSGKTANIISYIVSGEALNGFQRNVGLRAEGNLTIFLPGVGKNAADRHRMSNVKAAFSIYQDIMSKPHNTFNYKR